jgi:hypothetical protein
MPTHITDPLDESKSVEVPTIPAAHWLSDLDFIANEIVGRTLTADEIARAKAMADRNWTLRVVASELFGEAAVDACWEPRTWEHAKLVALSHAGDGRATRELERRSHANRLREAIEWARGNLDREMSVTGRHRTVDERTVPMGGGLSTVTQVAIKHSSFRGRLRDLLAAGKRVPLGAPTFVGISAADLPDHAGDASRVTEDWQPAVWINARG